MRFFALRRRRPRGQLVGVQLIGTVPPKNFYFLCFAPLKCPKIFDSLALPTGQGRNFNRDCRRITILSKILGNFKGKQKIKFFWKIKAAGLRIKACCISCCIFNLKRHFLAGRRIVGNKKNRTTTGFSVIVRFLKWGG